MTSLLIIDSQAWHEIDSGHLAYATPPYFRYSRCMITQRYGYRSDVTFTTTAAASPSLVFTPSHESTGGVDYRGFTTLAPPSIMVTA